MAAAAVAVVLLVAGTPEPWSLTDITPPVPKVPAVLPGVAAFTRVCTYDRPGTYRAAARPGPVPSAS
ncbi:hypothetical protein ABT234_35730 [Streptomyces sp. NPDC001586]|uniref:hypothetical protein n=1 Tax=Streptomyces sp. NPDC001586 TaxID=3154387 RepID=UPI0033302F5D